MTPPGRDRLRELLDAVLDEDNRSLVALRRCVVLERAAWQLRQGARVTGVALAAGYESVEGFSRAFARAYGHPPGSVPRGEPPRARDEHWLPAPNGLHFHPPSSLWVSGEPVRRGGDEVTALMVQHGAVLEHLVWTLEVWVASLEGADTPARKADDPAVLLTRHDAVAPRWLAAVREVSRRGAWDDRLVDALCEPPESFVLSSVVAHVLTFSAHRRLLARLWLREAGVEVDTGDPIEWLTRRNR